MDFKTAEGKSFLAPIILLVSMHLDTPGPNLQPVEVESLRGDERVPKGLSTF